jgi:Raf kinase inhibitor-like YbhB/YbcL family protein
MKKILEILLAAGIILCIVSAASPERNSPKGGGMKLSSPAFENNGPIPVKYTGDGADINPPLVIENLPAGTKSLVLIVDDPDAPMGVWLHWLVYDIAPVTKIAENSIPGTQGINDFRKKNYGGPYPPSGTHRYFFRLYALDTVLKFPEGQTRKTVEKAMEGHILGKAELVGTYKRR